jgi:hypothetical protein
MPQKITKSQQPSLNTQRNTTNSVVAGAFIQTGHGMVSAASGTDAAETVTFPIAFTSKPVVICQFEGYGGGGVYTDAPTDTWGGMTFSAQGQTTTGFVARGRRNDGSSLGGDYYYSWIAIGA